MMAHDIVLAVWFFLPAGVANVMPILAAKLPLLAKYNNPVDGGIVWRQKRILGDNKTWRGLVAGVASAVAVIWLQRAVASHGIYHDLEIIYTSTPVFVLGIALGIGALGGDMVKSFVKRRLNIASGKTWIPFDQVDYIVGAIVMTYLLYPLTLTQYVLAIVIWTALHFVSSYTGWALGLKKTPV